MKNLIMMAVIALCVAGVSAQKGTWYLGTSGIAPFSGEGFGDLSPITGVTMSKTGDAKTTTYGIAPEVGYFFADNMAVGLGIFYAGQSNDSGIEGDDTEKFNMFGFNPYFRYYFLGNGNFKMYGQLNVLYASGKEDGADDSLTNFGVNIKPGISYNLSDRFAINATFGELGYASQKFGDGDATNTFGLDLDMSSLMFGFTVSF